MIDANITKLNPKTPTPRNDHGNPSSRARVRSAVDEELSGKASQREADQHEFESRERRAENGSASAITRSAPAAPCR